MSCNTRALQDRDDKPGQGRDTAGDSGGVERLPQQKEESGSLQIGVEVMCAKRSRIKVEDS